MTAMKKNMAPHLNKSLPLDVFFLMYLKGLDPPNYWKEILVIRIQKLAQLLLDVITEREITSMYDKFKLLKVEQVPNSWFKEKDGNLKCIYMYWAKIFDFQYAEERKSIQYCRKL